MDYVRNSLLYPILVLWVAGTGLLLFPDTMLKLLQSNRTFDSMLSRLTGMFIIGLAMFVTLVFRLQVKPLYKWTVIIRLFFLVILSILVTLYGNPLFTVILIILTLGLLFTLMGYYAQGSRKNVA